MEKHMLRPPEDENSPFTGYIRKVPGSNFMTILKDQLTETPALMRTWSDEQWNFRYAEGKWSLKELILHLIDTERIFAYRALRIARNDKTPLPGFEQDDYIPYLNAEHRSPPSIIEEYQDTRKATITMFKHFSGDMLMRTGTASGNPLTVLSLGFMIAGHEIHHREIIDHRYVKK